MFFGECPTMQLQRRLDSEAENLCRATWTEGCGEDDACATRCARETDESSFAHKPIFAAAHPRDGGEVCCETNQ